MVSRHRKGVKFKSEYKVARKTWAIIGEDVIFFGGIMRESTYQHQLIEKLYEMFDGCMVLKNDSSYIQGIPDLTIFYGPCWATLEVKASAKSPEQPNQPWYVERMNEMSFSAFIYPENEEEVLNELQHAFSRCR